jgi:hypothetical protein
MIKQEGFSDLGGYGGSAPSPIISPTITGSSPIFPGTSGKFYMPLFHSDETASTTPAPTVQTPAIEEKLDTVIDSLAAIMLAMDKLHARMDKLEEYALGEDVKFTAPTTPPAPTWFNPTAPATTSGTGVPIWATGVQQFQLPISAVSSMPAAEKLAMTSLYDSVLKHETQMYHFRMKKHVTP